MSSKKILYVGGITGNCSEEHLAQAFNAFGYLKSVQIPKDKNYAFVEFEEEEDCRAAMDNMNGSEMNGKTLAVNLAYKRPSAGAHGKAVWEGNDEEEEGEAVAAENAE